MSGWKRYPFIPATSARASTRPCGTARRRPGRPILANTPITHNNYGYDRTDTVQDERCHHASHHQALGQGLWQCVYPQACTNKNAAKEDHNLTGTGMFAKRINSRTCAPGHRWLMEMHIAKPMGGGRGACSRSVTPGRERRLDCGSHSFLKDRCHVSLH